MPLTMIIGKPSTTNIRRQVLQGALLCLVLVSTLPIWVAVVSSSFGYRVAVAWGTSMEPALRNGDALWVKQLDIADLHFGDIITVTPYGEESTTHRVIKIEHLSDGSYLLTTKGDTNNFTEDWKTGAYLTVAVVVARVPFGGYVLDFLASIFGMSLVYVVLVILFVIWVLRRRTGRASPS